MSEQKYYVKLRQEVFISDRCGHGGIICHTWLSEDYDFSEELFRQSFTKSELAKIMDGALYKRQDYYEFTELPLDWVIDYKGDKTDRWLCEWINPLIELVPIYEV